MNMNFVMIGLSSIRRTISAHAGCCGTFLFQFVLSTLILFCDQLAWSQNGKNTLAGVVVDASTGETLASANVLLMPARYGTATDMNGRFSFTSLPPGIFDLQVSYLGFETYQDSIRLDSATLKHLRIAMQPKALTIPEVTITAEREQLTKEVNLSQDYLSNQQVRMSSAVAEPDLLRSLAVLPGVIQANDYNSRFYVRGGQGNENQVLVDGVTIHNPFHALGLFSAFNVDAIKAVEFYRGIFPARYSERLSSVTNVILRDGNAQRFSGSGMISLATSKLLLEGPLLKYNPSTGRKWTFMINGRSTYLNAIIDTPASFYDLSAKSVYDSGQKTKIILHGFYSSDYINDISDAYPNIHWNNRAVGVDWQHFSSPTSFFRTQFAYSDFRSDANNPRRVLEEGQSFLRQKNNIQETSLHVEWSKRYSRFFHLNLGYGFSKFSIDQYLNSFFDEVFLGSWREHDQHNAYVSLEGGVGEHLIYDIGASALYFSTEQAYKLSPRLGMKYLLNDSWRLKGGLGRHYQSLTTINDDDDPLILFDAWLPSPANRPIPHADHYGFGVEFSRSTSLQTDLEFYYRRYGDLTRYNRSQREGEPFYLDGWAESYGAEIRVSYDWKWCYGFANYALGYATSHFFLRNQPMRFENDFRWQTFPSAADVRHTINAVVGFRRGGKWEMSLAAIFQTGRPYTARLGDASVIYDLPRGVWPPFDEPILQGYFASESVYSSKNGLRFPFYQRVDFHAARNFNWLGMECSFFTQVYNLLFRKNTAFYIATDKKVFKGLPIVPTFGLTFRF